MPYRFATERQDYSDFAAGRVLRVPPGYPALPVRLADELFRRCLAARGGPAEGLVLFDPCCGAAYQLSALGLLHAHTLVKVIGSDVDPGALAVAAQNLGLLSPEGLALRARELEALAAQFGKEAHRDALASARRLRDRLAGALGGRRLEVEHFAADALAGDELPGRLGGQPVDVVVADVPYGALSQWRAPAGAPDPLWALLDSLAAALRPGAVAGVVTDKAQRAAHPAFRRAEQFQVGRRRAAVLVRLE